MDATVPTILLVEDSPATRAFLAENLEADDYDVLQAESLREALEVLDRSFPDLVIVDLGLPDGDGLDLLKYVRETDRTVARVDADLPLLVLSGRASDLERLRGFERGCDDYVTKPFAYQELRGFFSSEGVIAFSSICGTFAARSDLRELENALSGSSHEGKERNFPVKTGWARRASASARKTRKSPGVIPGSCQLFAREPLTRRLCLVGRCRRSCPRRRLQGELAAFALARASA